MNKKTKKIICRIVIIFLSALIGVVCYTVYDMYKRPTKIPSVDKLIDEKKKKDYEKEEVVEEAYVNELPNARSQFGNDDIVGRIQVPNLNIDGWVVRSDNNNYYLNYNIYRQYDLLGATFFDYRNTNLGTDKQINIYGHNTNNPEIAERLPLINLEAFVDKGMFDNYKDIYLSIDEKRMHYEIVAVKIINGSDNEHMKIRFSDTTDFLTHASRLLQNSLYQRENVEIDADSRLIVLQICHYNPPETYLIVIGKEV